MPDDLLIHTTVTWVGRKTHTYQDTHICIHIHMYISTISYSLFSSDILTHIHTFNLIDNICITHTNTFCIIIAIVKFRWNIKFFFFKFLLSTLFEQICVELTTEVLPFTEPQEILFLHKALDCRIVVCEFKLQSRYYVHFQTNTLGKTMNLLILPVKG